MNPVSKRETKFQNEYRDMTQCPLMMPEVGIIDLTTYHLHHLARYVCRLRGFSANLGKPLKDFVDTDLGGCLLGCLPIIEQDILSKLDSNLTALWRDFVVEVERFQSSDPQLEPDDLEGPLGKICEYLKFDPWPPKK